MIDAHSAFLQHVADGRLLDVEDLAADRQQRLELRVARQLGRAERGVALDDEQLAAFDVVAAAVGQLGRQRATTPSAFLRRWMSFADARRRASAARRRPSPGRRAPAPSRPRLVEVRNAFSSLGTTLATIRVAADVPSTSLVWPSNCGSASRTVTTAVRPSRTSSLMTSSSPALQQPRVAVSTFVERLGQRRARSPATWVPPLGVAMMLTNERTLGVVARAPAQRDVDVQLALDVLRASCGPASSSTGTVSVK